MITMCMVVLAGLVLGAAPVMVDAQEAQTIEERYLASAVSVDILTAQIANGGQELQGLALQAIADGLASGTLMPTDERLYYAIEPAVDRGVVTIDHSMRRTILTYGTSVREEAVRVLALLGTEQAQEKLLTVAMYDAEPQLRVVALRGISTIAVDPEGTVSTQIGQILSREHFVYANPGTVYASVIALEGIARRDGNQFAPNAQAMLVEVASDHQYVQLVRQRALMVLSML